MHDLPNTHKVWLFAKPWPSMSRQRRHAILREVRDADPQLQKLGMELYIQSDGRLMVSYHPTGDITFANPPKAEIE